MSVRRLFWAGSGKPVRWRWRAVSTKAVGYYDLSVDRSGEVALRGRDGTVWVHPVIDNIVGRNAIRFIMPNGLTVTVVTDAPKGTIYGMNPDYILHDSLNKGGRK